MSGVPGGADGAEADAGAAAEAEAEGASDALPTAGADAPPAAADADRIDVPAAAVRATQ